MSLIAIAAGTVLMMQTAGAEIARAEHDRLEACVAKIETDPENAYEDGLAWTYEGNRPGARQCTALALIALGQYETGAERLESLSTSSDAGTLEQRAIYLSQAGQAWIMAGAPDIAAETFSAALEFAPGTLDLLLDRASAYIMLEDWDKALSDLDYAIANSPSHGPAYQLRAKVYLNQKQHDLAMRDVKTAMDADPKNIETLVLRGEVREAIRLAEADGAVAKVD